MNDIMMGMDIPHLRDERRAFLYQLVFSSKTAQMSSRFSGGAEAQPVSNINAMTINKTDFMLTLTSFQQVNQILLCQN